MASAGPEFEYPPNSRDLLSSDYHLFPQLKNNQEGIVFKYEKN